MSGPEAAGAGSNGTEAGGPDGPSRSAPPMPLVLSSVAGLVGFVLLVAGVVAGNTELSVAGVVAGSGSLVAALYWRSLLIASWAAQKQGRPPR